MDSTSPLKEPCRKKPWPAAG